MGIGGLNSTMMSTEVLLVQDPEEYATTAEDSKFVAIDKTGKMQEMELVVEFVRTYIIDEIIVL